ncbi:hypothetical protein GCM10027321_20280 [Massilia terrae]|uniref:DUF3566 domain-containing protein n=1 Tax=Massilia terrae TaxID=1811224 RepID=A0ABT2CVU7_9BURK|nr:hypothetical protein [Massilia terrae]MCS0657964.1 hypothetical protein [Massilia terrae]
MKKQIIRFSVLQNAKVMAVLYVVMSLLVMAITMVPMLMTGQMPAGGALIFFVLTPVLYALTGFVFTVIGAWLYNFIARFVGGIEFSTVEVNRD